MRRLAALLMVAASLQSIRFGPWTPRSLSRRLVRDRALPEFV